MNLDRNNIHIKWNEISQKKIGIGGQILPQLPWKQKRGGFNFLGISLIKLHEAL
jgi:hypothetical protein